MLDLVRKHALSASLVLATWAPHAAALSNFQFENPNVGTTWLIYPANSGWTFDQNGWASGIAATTPGNLFTSGNNFFETGQVAFIQNQGRMSQQLRLKPGETYVVTLSAAQRTNSQLGTQTVRVVVSGGSFSRQWNFTPTDTTTGQFQHFVSPSFTVPTDRQYTLAFEGAGGGGSDYTAFIDNVAVNKVTELTWGSTATPPTSMLVTNVNSPGNPSVCDLTRANMGHDFSPPTFGTEAGMWLRRMMPAGAHMVTPIAWDLFPYTGLTNTCNWGRVDANVAQSGFEVVGNKGGFLLLSSESTTTNIEAVYGFRTIDAVLGPSRATIWGQPGNSLRVEGKLRVSMFSPAFQPGYFPTGQLYFAIVLVDDVPYVAGQSQPSYIQISVLAYDSRMNAPEQYCDQLVLEQQNDPFNKPFTTTFHKSAMNCTGKLVAGVNKGKLISIVDGRDSQPAESSNVMVFGNQTGPGYGAWGSPIYFSARLTTESLQKAITIAGQTRPASAYRLFEVGIMQEMSWGSTTAVDMSSAFEDLRVWHYVAK